MIIVVMMKVTFEKYDARIDSHDTHPPKPTRRKYRIDPSMRGVRMKMCRDKDSKSEFQKSKSNSSRQTIRENQSCKSIDEQATRNDDFWFRNDFRIISENHFQAAAANNSHR